MSDNPVSFIPLPDDTPPPSCTAKHGCIGVAIVALVGLGCMLALYYGHENFHTWVNHIFSDTQLSGQEALLYISVPIVGASLLIGICAHIYRKHQQKVEAYQIYPYADVSLLETIKECLPTTRSLKITAIVLGILALTAVAGYGVSQIPDVNQWLHQDAIPFIKNFLEYKFALWESLGYVGGTTASVSLLIGSIIGIDQFVKERQAQANIQDLEVYASYVVDRKKQLAEQR